MKKPTPFRLISGCFFSLAMLAYFSCVSLKPGGAGQQGLAAKSVPESEPAQEFRAVWVATFMNIDWPSSQNLDIPSMKAQSSLMLDQAAAMGLNAVFLQVRPCGDAFYKSALVPWSSYLSGEQGRAPADDFDPLQYWVEGAHKRNMQLYAWLNPLRVGAPSIKAYADTSPAAQAPDWVLPLGDKAYVWLDPGRDETRAYLRAVLRELISNYTVDGVVIDDYFYPYPEQYPSLPDFPDNSSYNAYLSAGGKRAKADWRRENVNALVYSLYSEIKADNPALRFGISPAGIWRPDNPSGVRGRDAWAESYADSSLWLEQGWCDFLSPQLYWPRSAPYQPFDKLLEFWASRNVKGKSLWPSLRLASPSVPEGGRAAETLSEIEAIRARLPGDSGFALYSWKALAQNACGLREAITEGLKAQSVTE
jgi:uncharacterized lipoprotein YddW (UPF0748 family)